MCYVQGFWLLPERILQSQNFMDCVRDQTSTRCTRKLLDISAHTKRQIFALINTLYILCREDDFILCNMMYEFCFYKEKAETFNCCQRF